GLLPRQLRRALVALLAKRRRLLHGGLRLPAGGGRLLRRLLRRVGGVLCQFAQVAGQPARLLLEHLLLGLLLGQPGGGVPTQRLHPAVQLVLLPRKLGRFSGRTVLARRRLLKTAGEFPERQGRLLAELSRRGQRPGLDLARRLPRRLGRLAGLLRRRRRR